MLPQPSVKNQPEVLLWLQNLDNIGLLTRSLAISESQNIIQWNANFDTTRNEESPLHEDATIPMASMYFSKHFNKAGVQLKDVIKMTIWIPGPTIIWQVTFLPSN